MTGLASLSRPPRSLGAVPDRPPLLPHEPFTFLFITDAHIQPELAAARGCHDCFRHAHMIPADFVMQGGDHVFDALGVGRPRAMDLMKLYLKTELDLGLPVHHTIGNHDCLGIYTKSGVSPKDVLYGKKYFQDCFGSLHYSFDHKGVHFVVLDSIGITGDRAYEGRIDAEQIDWLRHDLATIPAGMPVVVSVHIPLVTALDVYLPAPEIPPRHQSLRVVNSGEILDLFDTVNVIAVLQGHTHVLERVDWHGVPYITGGAVSGNWWHGTRLGTREGFLVVDVANGRVSTRYETYGFKSIDPHDT
ncbi:hypothetical protein GCM10023157_18290 [Gluconacetobacter asukensis]